MEVIDLINELKDFRNKGFLDCNVEAILLKLKKIEYGGKVKVPDFVADLIEYAKIRDWDLEDVFLNIANELDTSEISEWFYTQGNMDVIARAWLDGYEIEKEKRYLVKIKGNVSEDFLVFGLVTQVYFFSKDNRDSKCRQTTHTRKELEKAGFGWVFDCPGIEVKEVTE